MKVSSSHLPTGRLDASLLYLLREHYIQDLLSFCLVQLFEYSLLRENAELHSPNMCDYRQLNLYLRCSPQLGLVTVSPSQEDCGDLPLHEMLLAVPNRKCRKCASSARQVLSPAGAMHGSPQNAITFLLLLLVWES